MLLDIVGCVVLYGAGTVLVAIGLTGLARTIIFDLRAYQGTPAPVVQSSIALGVGCAGFVLAKALSGFLLCLASP
jgi:hypothetical protein